MTTGKSDTYVFEKGQFLPLQEPDTDQMQWGIALEEQGYDASERVWGHYPDAYLKVFEARAGASVHYQFAAVLKFVTYTHHVFLRDLNDLIQCVRLLQPLLSRSTRPADDRADALYGTQGADEQPADQG